jgi:4-hydroxybenzoyl-CoA reductase subunit beta
VLLPEFTLLRPRSLAEAAELAANPLARVIAGGTGLVPNLRLGVEAPRALVSLERLGELRGIEFSQSGIRIGACVSLQELCDDARLPDALREAARSVGAPGHRSAATLGGNLCLDTRCLYYNQSEHWRRSSGYCLKRGGELCHVAPRGSVCRAAFSGDLAPALLALEAEMELFSPAGITSVKPLHELYRDDGANCLTLERGAIVAAVRVPARELRSGYAKARRRGAIDFPLAGVAIAAALDGARLRQLRVALTGTNSMPLLVKGVEELLGAEVGPAVETRLGKLVERQVKPLRTTIGAADYRRQVAVALARRLLARLTTQGGWQ